MLAFSVMTTFLCFSEVDPGLSAQQPQRLLKHFDAVESLDLSLNAVDINFTPIEGSGTKVIISGDLNNINIKNSNGNLKISSIRWAGLDGKKKTGLAVYMPKTIRSVNINIGKGTVLFQHGTSADLNISGGYLSFRGTNVLGAMDFRLGNGTIALDYTINRLARPIKQNVLAGTVEITVTLSRAFRTVNNSLKSSNSDLRMELPTIQLLEGENIADFNLSGMASRAQIDLRESTDGRR
jgi:hypothetical protein